LTAVLPDSILNQNKLLNSMWGPEDGRFGLYIKFSGDVFYELSFKGEGGSNNIMGKYTIDNNKLILEPITGEADKIFKELTITQTFDYITDSRSFYHSGCLINDKIKQKFYELNSDPVICEKVIDGVALDFKGIKLGKINTNAFIRQGPGKQFNYYIFFLAGLELSDKGSPFLPIGYELIILGKTKNIEEIQGLKGYWLYCDIQLG